MGITKSTDVRTSSQKAGLIGLLRAPAVLAWCLFVFAQPFYVLPTGLPQPGDILLLPLLPLALHGWNMRLSRRSARVVKALAWFVAWVAIVQYAWVLLIGQFTVIGREGMVLFPLYYLYNALVVLAALVLHDRYGEYFLRMTMRTVLLVVFMLVVSSFVISGSSLRGTLFFANPNQLGYHALLSGCVIALAQRRLRYASLTAAIGLSGCAYLALISASRSAVAGVAVLVVLMVFSNLRVILIASIAAILALQIGGPLARGIDASEQRAFTPRQSKLSFFEQRGYDRIWNNKQYLLLGAGEGGNSRFKETTAIGYAEIHSSAATLLFCYGFVGVVLFGAFVWRVLQGSGLRSSLMLLPPLLYTFAHQGLRFTMLWVLLAAFVALKALPDVAPIEIRRALKRTPRPEIA